MLSAIAIGRDPRARGRSASPAGRRRRWHTGWARRLHRVSSGRTRCGSSGSPTRATRRATAAPRSSRCTRSLVRAVSWLVGRPPAPGGAARLQPAPSSARCWSCTTSRFASSPSARRAHGPSSTSRSSPPRSSSWRRTASRCSCCSPLVAFREARRDRWAIAALAGALAAMTRSVGLVLAPALLAAMARRAMAGARRRSWPRWSRAAAVACGPAPLPGMVGARARRRPWLRSTPRRNWQRVAVAFPLITARSVSRSTLAAGQGYWILDCWLIDLLSSAWWSLIRRARLERLPPAYFDRTRSGACCPALLSVPAAAAALGAAVRRRCSSPAFWVLADAVERGDCHHTAGRRHLRGRLRPADNPVHELVVHLLNSAIQDRLGWCEPRLGARTEDGA